MHYQLSYGAFMEHQDEMVLDKERIVYATNCVIVSETFSIIPGLSAGRSVIIQIFPSHAPIGALV